jgi:hypothetical protein
MSDYLIAARMSLCVGAYICTPSMNYMIDSRWAAMPSPPGYVESKRLNSINVSFTTPSKSSQTVLHPEVTEF